MTDCELVNTECLSRIFESLSLHIFQFKTVSSSVLLRNILNKISDSLLQRMHTSEQNEKGMTDLTTTVKLKSSEKLIHTWLIIIEREPSPETVVVSLFILTPRHFLAGYSVPKYDDTAYRPILMHIPMYIFIGWILNVKHYQWHDFTWRSSSVARTQNVIATLLCWWRRENLSVNLTWIFVQFSVKIKVVFLIVYNFWHFIWNCKAHNYETCTYKQ